VSAITGLGVSGGVARGPVVKLRPGVTTPASDPLEALRGVAEELASFATELGGEAAEILGAQSEMALDPEVHSAVEAARANGSQPKDAILDGFAPFRAALESASSEYQRQRVADVDEVARRAVDRLEGRGAAQRWPPVPGILVGESIGAADTAIVPQGELLGIVSGDGGDRSHAAILARALAIPAVLGLGRGMLELSDGKWVSVDGDAGLVEVVEDQHSRAYVSTPHSPTENVGEQPSQMADGEQVDLRANVGTIADADLANAQGLTASGLVRTEFLFAGRAEAPSVDEQMASYRAVLERLAGEVIFRLLDAGGDKPFAYLPVPAAANPALAIRGIRLLLRHPDVLQDQLRGICRVADSDRVAVMLPMVSRAEEIHQARTLASKVFTSEGVTLRLGAMLEVPAAALAVEELAEQAEFFSLGTNDLLQHLFAADRGLGELDSLVAPLPAAVWSLLATTIEAAHAAGRPIGVCGELAGDEQGAGVLRALGADSLSINPLHAANVRATLRLHSMAEWRERAQALTGEKPT
jgi:phosphoenolpyruvate-protein kinase (PTS system EI component)